jgi:hypothetical protein
MDVLADVLATVRFQAALSGSLRVAAPWALVGALDGHAHVYLIVEGGAQLALPARRPRRPATSSCSPPAPPTRCAMAAAGAVRPA